MLYESIKKLVQYGIDTGITPESERIYTTNLLLDVMKEDDYEDVDCDLDTSSWKMFLQIFWMRLSNEALSKTALHTGISLTHGS